MGSLCRAVWLPGCLCQWQNGRWGRINLRLGDEMQRIAASMFWESCSFGPTMDLQVSISLSSKSQHQTADHILLKNLRVSAWFHSWTISFRVVIFPADVQKSQPAQPTAWSQVPNSSHCIRTPQAEFVGQTWLPSLLCLIFVVIPFESEIDYLILYIYYSTMYIYIYVWT